MKLLVILLCLLSERFLIHTISYQRFYWFNTYCISIKNLIDKHFAFNNPWALLVAIIAPLVLLTSLVYFLFHNILFGFSGLILSIIIFSYCLGPQNAFYPLSADSETDNQNEIGHYFFQVNRQLFSVIFWYIIAGPIAILTYRLITLSRDFNPISIQANWLTDILEWIPARISSLLYLLVGNFQRGFIPFTKLFFAPIESNHHILSQCGVEAVRNNDSDEIPMPVAECLVEHATIVFIVFIALFTIAAWL